MLTDCLGDQKNKSLLRMCRKWVLSIKCSIKKIQTQSSADKTSTTETITEVKELVEEVIPEKEQTVDKIGEDKDLNGVKGTEKSEQITLNDTTEQNSEAINMDKEENKNST